ncbi:unnamed protein product [Didymodactylos carnosus]|nr:unnamed protein product [Didymodactylos carnosus]
MIQLRPSDKLFDIENTLKNDLEVDMNVHHIQFFDNRVGKYVNLDENYFNGANELLLWSKNAIIELQVVSQQEQQQQQQGIDIIF